MIDFSSYSLVLMKDDKIVYSSSLSGLRPLLECVIKYKGKIEGCTLYDKVIGLAAAKIAFYSGFIEEVKTPLASISAFDYLEKKKIPVLANETVDKICNKDKTGMCPMEERALRTQDEEELFKELRKIFRL
jgi:hypothetical protein